MANFEIGGVTIPYESGDGSLRQTYAPKHEGEMLLMGDGSSIKQSLDGALDKLKTTIASSNMWAQALLAGLDYSSSMLLKCAEPRGVYGATNIITVPTKRRSDTGYTPIGYGIVDGRMIKSDVSINVDEVTVTPVSGATSYMVSYFPEITVFTEFQESMNAAGSTYAWQLTCEEV